MSALETNTLAAATRPRALATEIPRGRAPAWWGMVLFVVTEATLFAVLLACYFYLRFTSGGPWPLGGIKEPELAKPLLMTALLFGSSGPMFWADWAVRRGHQRQLAAGLALTWLLGAVFLTLQALEYHTKLQEFTWTSNAYGSLFYTITGFHGFHVTVGLAMVGFAEAAALLGRFGIRRHQRVRLVAFYWHFIGGIWLLILCSLYLSPRL